MKIAFYTLGCKVNQYESAALQEMMQAKGYCIVDFNSEADVYLVNSCNVTETSEKKSISLVKSIKNKHPDSIVVLTGCFPQAFPDKAKNTSADIVCGTKDRKSILKYIEEFIKSGTRQENIPPHLPNDTFEEMSVSELAGHTRAFLKIQDGCDRYCSYCIIPKSRGFIRSKPLDAIVKEAKSIANNGYQEIVLTGINLSLYGKKENINICDAIFAVASVDEIKRIRLGSLEPELMTEEIIAAISKCEKLCPQFHLSLQSGCDKTLKNMRRRYNCDDYRKVVKLLRKYFKNCSITTDIMVGFSGENDEDFDESCRFAQEIGFAKIHVFPYSIRKGTVAENFPEKVSRAEKMRRSKIMQSIAKKSINDFADTQVGQTVSVLFETPNENYNCGRSKNYTEVWVPYNENLQGKIHNVKITGSENGICFGELD